MKIKVEYIDIVRFTRFDTHIVAGTTTVCDGEQAAFYVMPFPWWDVSNAVVNMAVTNLFSTTNWSNPAGKLSTVEQIDEYNWRVNNARWYAIGDDLCNDTAHYIIDYTADFDGLIYQGAFPLTVSASLGGIDDSTCLGGLASITNWFSGDIEIYTVHTGSNRWESTVSQGTFLRDIQAFSRVTTPINSQFYAMIKNEEEFHEIEQLENKNHYLLSNYWSAERVISALRALEPFVGATGNESIQFARAEFNRQVDSEIERSDEEVYAYPGEIRCALEAEAKSRNSSHRAVMGCAYPDCQ